MGVIRYENIVRFLSGIISFAILLCLTSCFSSKEPVYDLGPHRSPQDNQSILRSKTEGQQAPRPLVPGYDIPAPRSSPLIIDAPTSNPSLPPQSFAPPRTQFSALEGGKRRPIRQFTGGPIGLPGSELPFPPPPPVVRVNAPPQPAYVAAPAQQKKSSFFGHIKDMFTIKKKNKAEPKRPPQGQGYLVNGAAPRINGQGFSVESEGPNLDDELQQLKTPAENAADTSPPSKPKTPVSKKQTSKTPQSFKLKTPDAWKKEDAKRKPTTHSKKKVAPPVVVKTPKKIATPTPPPPAAPKVVAPSAPPPIVTPPPPVVTPDNGGKTLHEQIEDNWNQQQQGPDDPDKVPLSWEKSKVSDKKLQTIPEDQKQQPPATDIKTVPAQKSEVLMEFDISKDGELVGIPDLAPAAGKEAHSSNNH